MSKVVKAIAVVDERPPARKTLADVIEAELNNIPVIKRQLFDYRDNPYADPELVLPNKQGYIDELNRIKVEIAQTKDELRILKGELEHELNPPEEFTFEIDSEDPAEIARLAQMEAERMLRETRENVMAMTAAYEEESKRAAKELAEESKNNGYLEGFDQGFAQARKEFIEENSPKAQELDRLLEAVSGYHEEQIAQSEQDLLNLVMTVVEKVLGREMKEDPRAVVSMLYSVLEQNRREENIRITVSPDLMPIEAKAAADVKKLVMQVAPGAAIHVSADAEPGTVVVETDDGITDISLKTQLENIREALQG